MLRAFQIVCTPKRFEMDESDVEGTAVGENESTTSKRALNITSNPLTSQKGHVSASQLILILNRSKLCSMYSRLGHVRNIQSRFLNFAAATGAGVITNGITLRFADRHTYIKSDLS